MHGKYMYFKGTYNQEVGCVILTGRYMQERKVCNSNSISHVLIIRRQ